MEWYLNFQHNIKKEVIFDIRMETAFFRYWNLWYTENLWDLCDSMLMSIEKKFLVVCANSITSLFYSIWISVWYMAAHSSSQGLLPGVVIWTQSTQWNVSGALSVTFMLVSLWHSLPNVFSFPWKRSYTNDLEVIYLSIEWLLAGVLEKNKELIFLLPVLLH